jgi:hypothetical protein
LIRVLRATLFSLKSPRLKLNDLSTKHGAPGPPNRISDPRRTL